MRRVRLATRTSELALAQARAVALALETELGIGAELLPLKTTGDRLRGSLAQQGGKGLFVKEIEEALLEGRADLAVHSAKDLPATLPEGLALVAFPERADARDALVTRERGGTLAALPRGARVGTGSLRRGAQLRALRPDLVVVPLRGNVPTRLRKLEQGGLDALVVACAGLERLGRADRIDERIAPEQMLPAVAQGIVAVEGRCGDPLAAEVAVLSHAQTAAQAVAERALLARLGADCNVPLAGWAEPRGGSLRLRALLLDLDGRRPVRAVAEAPAPRAAELGRQVGERLLRDGGEALLAELRESGT